MEANSKGLADFDKRFPNEQACRDYLERARWNGKPVCAQCGSTRRIYHVANGKLLKCADCKRQFSVKVGTIFEDSALPLRKWFMAIYILTAHKKGISSVQLSKDIQVTQKTAWFMLHRIRYAVEYKSFVKPLTGTVEADETYIGGLHHRGPHQPRGDKEIVFGMIQRDGEVRAKHIPHARTELIFPIMERHISCNAILMTDESHVYLSIGGELKEHHVVNHSSKKYVRGDVHTNSIEGFWAHMKRGINGIYHHVSKEHLQRYTDEYVYRYNTRKISDPDRFAKCLREIEGRLTWKKLTEK